MLAGGFREAGSGSPVDIKGTTAAAFRALLAYFYTDELQFSEADVVHVMAKAKEIQERARRFNPGPALPCVAAGGWAQWSSVLLSLAPYCILQP